MESLTRLTARFWDMDRFCIIPRDRRRVQIAIKLPERRTPITPLKLLPQLAVVKTIALLLVVMVGPFCMSMGLP